MTTIYRLREACSFFPYDGLPGEVSFIVKTPDSRQFKISSTAMEILLQLDGNVTLDEVATQLGSRSIDISAEELSSLITTKYQSLGIVEDINEPSSSLESNGREREVSLPARLPFLLHWNLIPAQHVQFLSERLRSLFYFPIVLLAVCAILAAHYFIYFGYPASYFPARAEYVQVLALCLLSILCHEFGHSSAVSRYGGSPGGIGFGLFVLLPSFYADVSEAWQFSRKHRMVVDVGGIYFQQIFFAAAAGLGLLTAKPEFFAVCRFIDLLVFVNLNPVFRFDGYWLLADWLALPNLHKASLKFIAEAMRRIAGKGRATNVFPPIPRQAYSVFLVYSVLSTLSLVAMLGLSVRYVASTIDKAPLLLPNAFRAFTVAIEQKEIIYIVNTGLMLFFAVAFPVTIIFGITSYGVILFRYVLEKARLAKLGRDLKKEFSR